VNVEHAAPSIALRGRKIVHLDQSFLIKERDREGFRGRKHGRKEPPAQKNAKALEQGTEGARRKTQWKGVRFFHLGKV